MPSQCDVIEETKYRTAAFDPRTRRVLFNRGSFKCLVRILGNHHVPMYSVSFAFLGLVHFYGQFFTNSAARDF